MSNFIEGVEDMGKGLVLGAISETCKPVVVGIDFGTAYSGIAFALKADPGTIQCGAPNALDTVQMKVPTALLEQADGTWLFGYNAEKKYNDILLVNSTAEPGTPLPGHLYRRFKMVLKDKESGFDTLTAFSLAGKPHSLLDLTVRSLTFLKDFALEKVSGGFGGDVNPHQDVQWVLTVPAIWNDFGKAFMRRAAFQAGLIEDEQSDNLILVLEPEGASLAVHVGAAQYNLLGVGSQFMVLDCGGGTVDITVHEVLTVKPLTMKAIAPPTGGDWGGDYVNMEFKKFLAELLGPDLFKEDELPLEFYGIYAEFDKIKIMYDPDQEPGNLRLMDVLDNRRHLVALANAWNEKHPEKPIVKSPSQNNGFLTLSKALMLSFFEPFLRATVDETRRVLRTIPGIRHIMVVGGFGSCKVLTARVRMEFHEKNGVVVVLPSTRPKPQGAIVHGAVYYGLHKNIIQSRVSSYSYGVEFVEGTTKNVFHILVKKGQTLPHDHEVSSSSYPVEATQTAITLNIYRSDKENPTTTVGEHFLGKVWVDCPLDPVHNNRKQTAVYRFGGSEIRVKVVNFKKAEFQGVIAMK